MKECEKLLEQMRRTKSGFGQSDFEDLYLGFGFDKQERGKHCLYQHRVHRQLIATVGRHNSLAKGYAHAAVKIIDTLKSLEQEEVAQDVDVDQGAQGAE